MNIEIEQLMNVRKEKLKSTLGDVLSQKNYLEEIEAINSILEDAKKIQLPLIESSNFESSLIERKQEIENQEELKFYEHILYFLLLIDYICYHQKEIPHKMSFLNNQEDNEPIFEGYFEDFLWNFQNSSDGAIFFCFYKTLENNTPLSLTNFENDVELIRNHFLEDIQLSDFDEVLSQYMEMRQNQGD